ncbi:trypsin-like serine peptidase [Dapis sp. BLCC M172]|uniref:trypsin-like serine peptidase n=1 Tax=Dapis sp. BLCC M172 TaxID=2975281 RepID=UPI003CF3E494
MTNYEIKPERQKALNSLGKSIPGNVPVRAPENTKQFPYWFVGKLSMEFPNGKKYLGTGTLIAAKFKGDTGLYVLTCAHNLYDKSDGGRAIKVSFQRGLNGQATPPYPVVEAVDWHYPAGYPSNSIPRNLDKSQLGSNLLRTSEALDYGLVKLKEKIEVTNAPEIVAKDNRELHRLNVKLVGLYGWEGHKNNMYVGTGEITVINPEQLGYPISTALGTSGTAVMTEDYSSIVAVHTHAGLPGDDHNYGRRMTDEVIEEIRGWQE